MKTRTTPPYNNPYYLRYRSGGNNGAVPGSPTISGADVLCNCVGYANGRFNEAWLDSELKGINKSFNCQLVCNAENFIESAKSQGLKISDKPVQGGIMVWQKGSTLKGYDGAGHVAFVEEVYKDGSILTSESGWGSLDWKFKNIRRDNSNGRWGQSSAYTFRGCIINPGVNGAVVSTPLLIVDGYAGNATIRKLQEYLGTPTDGVLSGQNKSLRKYYERVSAVEFGKGGSLCVKKLQEWAGTTVDGIWGQGTSKAVQSKLKSLGYDPGDIDGYFGANSVKALQRLLSGEKPKKKETKKTDAKKTATVIDVSEFQSAIDWKKVKASGVSGVIVRCGYRGAEKGTLNEDAMFMNHIKGAKAAGLKVGIYMFTEGINFAEGREEAVYAITKMLQAKVSLDYPIAVDTEAVNIKNERARNLTRAQRSEVIRGFCEEIKRQGYEPMIYASTSWLNNKLDMSKLPYKVWCAQYHTKCDYKGAYVMWQYSSKGSVNGVKGNVDLNECYM